MEDTHPTDLVNLEAANNHSEIVQKTYGYLNLDKSGFAERKLNDIVLSISQENPIDKHPLAIYKIGPRTVEIVFGSHEARESAANDGLAIFSHKVVVSRPRSLKKDKAIYLYGIPPQESAENIRKFFTDNLKLKVKSEIRWLNYPKTEIRNGGRSAVVECDDETEIPGCAFYESLTTKLRKITLWYPNMPSFCRRCMVKGHLARDCPKNFENVLNSEFPLPQAASYAMALKSSKNPAEKNDDVFPALDTFAKPGVHLRYHALSLHNDDDEYWPFFTKNDIMSNFYECNVEIGDVKYQSTEQYLFAERARKMKDFDTASKIMKNRSAKICKELGESVPWTGDVENWREFAKNKLKIANTAKYSQNEYLRKYLFKTSPAVLVEASPYDRYWGVGLKKNDANIQNPGAWRGENIMGYLLTDIRDELLNDPAMTIEKSSKRNLGSPDDRAVLKKRNSLSSV